MSAAPKLTTQEIAAQFGTSEKDTGNAKVQIAALTFKINALTEHLKLNKKDHATTRGLLAMVSRRRKLLNYLKRKLTTEAYKELLQTLNLRK